MSHTHTHTSLEIRICLRVGLVISSRSAPSSNEPKAEYSSHSQVAARTKLSVSALTSASGAAGVDGVDGVGGSVVSAVAVALAAPCHTKVVAGRSHAALA